MFTILSSLLFIEYHHPNFSLCHTLWLTTYFYVAAYRILLLLSHLVNHVLWHIYIYFRLLPALYYPVWNTSMRIYFFMCQLFHHRSLLHPLCSIKLHALCYALRPKFLGSSRHSSHMQNSIVHYHISKSSNIIQLNSLWFSIHSKTHCSH